MGGNREGEKLLNSTGKRWPMSMQHRVPMGSWKRERETCRKATVRMGGSQRSSSWPRRAWAPSGTHHTGQGFWMKGRRTWFLRVGGVEMLRESNTATCTHTTWGQGHRSMPWVNPLTQTNARNIWYLWAGWATCLIKTTSPSLQHCANSWFLWLVLREIWTRSQRTYDFASHC